MNIDIIAANKRYTQNSDHLFAVDSMLQTNICRSKRNKKDNTTNILVHSCWSKNTCSHCRILDFSAGLDRGIAKMATSPLAKAATAAIAKAGELPPPNNESHGPLPRDTTTYQTQANIFYWTS